MQIFAEPFTTYGCYAAWTKQRPHDELCDVVDGQPVVSPPPGLSHQRAVSRLLRMVIDACPDDHEVLPSPIDWLIWERPSLQVRQPDIVVVRRGLTTSALTEPPLLAIEILSPSSFERDTVTKRREYAQAGLPHYWIIDPDTPQVAIYRLQSAALDMASHATGETPIQVAEPFTMTFKPSDLLG